MYLDIYALNIFRVVHKIKNTIQFNITPNNSKYCEYSLKNYLRDVISNRGRINPLLSIYRVKFYIVNKLEKS